MDLDAFLRDLKLSGGRRQYLLFEAFIIDILNEYLRKQQKEFIPYYIYKNDKGTKLEYDGYAPNGIDKLLGPTSIEITFSDNRKALKDKLLGYIYKNKQNPAINSMLFINGYKLPNEFKDEIIHYSQLNGLNANVWDTTDLSAILEKYEDIQIENIHDLSEIIINRTVSHSLEQEPDEWKAKRDEQIYQLNKIYKNSGIIIFLGAGISKDRGIPEWGELISDLFFALISEKLNSTDIQINNDESAFLIKELKEMNDSSPLILASYIREGLDESFSTLLSSVLYKRVIRDESGLLKSLSNLCLPRRNGRGGVKAVVTYNFDDILETIFQEKGIDSKPIYKKADIPSQDELGIYHVHGFLPKKTEEYEDLSESLLVFSEDGYHSLLLNPYSWQNLVQLNFLREYTCVMIGLSMTDPNLRRLLTIPDLSKETPRHFAILKRSLYRTNNNIAENSNIRQDVIRAFLDVNQNLQEDSFKQLGLNIIWIDDYSEVPVILDLIRNNR